MRKARWSQCDRRPGRIPGGIRTEPGVFELVPGPFQLFSEPVFEPEADPETFVDFECASAAGNIQGFGPGPSSRSGPTGISFGSAGSFPGYDNGWCPTGAPPPRNGPDRYVKKLDLPDRSFHLVLSLCTLEHLGLGRYGDTLDFEADDKAFREMMRVLKPGGHLISRPRSPGLSGYRSKRALDL